jgi:DNA polymerase-3 subunit alpha
MTFVHLHTHSMYSILDGHGKPASYAERAAALCQPALAVTDHGSLGGAYQHWKECNRVGIKPIIGAEFYVAPGSRFDKTPAAGFSGSGKYAHITVLASGSIGLRNLFRLQARAHSEGFYGKARIDFDLLEEYREGLVVLSGCAGGHIATYLRNGQFKEAQQLAQRLRSSFGENFFIELMNHDIKEDDLDEEWLNVHLIRLADTLDVPLVATNDAHYCNPEDHDVQQALLCVATRDVLSNPNRFRFNGHGFHLRSHGEMVDTGLPQEAIENTLRIAERVESYDEVFAHTLRMPRYSDDEGYDLWQQADEGLRHRVGFKREYFDRLEYELEVINSMGYPGYFLVEAHILREGRKRGLTHGPGRGSAGGSLVSYALGITDLDPIAHGLLFERFLNPERVSLPDIDIDVPESERNLWLELIRELYGDEHVAIIGTYGSIGAKAALKDAARVLGHPYRVGEERCAHLPPAKFGRAPSLDKYDGPRDEIFDLARGLEGTIRQKGQHAAGVIISPEPLSDLLPLWHPADQKAWVTENDMHELDALGLIKYDFLGLRNLDVINEAMRLVGNSIGSLPTLPGDCNDQRTYELLSRGESLGVFQLDSPGMRGLLRQLRPKKFSDISAVLALYRPGPMGANAHTEFAKRANRNGGRWQSSWAIHPELEEPLRPVLEETYGLIVFQEQVLQALNVVCGWSYAEAGLLFDAMRKKNHEKMEATKPSFEDAGRKNGFSPDALEALWKTLVPFADYSFNRAHTAGYGLVAYWTAYLKSNYPTEYMAALLSSVSSDPDRLHEYLEEARAIGVEILPPDINESNAGFTPTKEGIRYGIAAIKGVGDKAFAAIAQNRPYRDLSDFYHRIPSSALNSGVVGALVRSGALDSLCANREGHEAICDRFVKLEQDRRKLGGQPLLVDPTYAVRSSDKRDIKRRREWEHATIGVEVSVGTVTIVPNQALTEMELEYIRRVIDQNPGQAPVVIDFGLSRVRTGAKISLNDKAMSALLALDLTLEER